MKKIILILAIFASIGLAAQGTLVQDNMILRTIPQYDISNGTSEWVIDLKKPTKFGKMGDSIHVHRNRRSGGYYIDSLAKYGLRR